MHLGQMYMFDMLSSHGYAVKVAYSPRVMYSGSMSVGTQAAAVAHVNVFSSVATMVVPLAELQLDGWEGVWQIGEQSDETKEKRTNSYVGLVRPTVLCFHLDGNDDV